MVFKKGANIMPRMNHLSRRRFLQSAGAATAAGCAGSAALAAETPPKKRRTHRYEELLPEEFYEEFQRAPIIYWTTAPMEEHGLHSPLGTDYYKGYEVCLRAVEISGGIVLPAVPLGPAARYSRNELRSGKQRLFPPSLWVSRELCKQVYIELLESMADLRFKACIAIGGHGPCDWILQEITKELGGRVGDMRFFGGGMSLVADMMRDVRKKHPKDGRGHGMMLETSRILATHPHLVDMARVKRIMNHPLDSQLKLEPRENIEYILNASAEMGNLQLDAMAQRAANMAVEMLKDAGAA